MPWDRFVRVLDQIDGRARFVGLYNWGEPFEHPRIYEMISEVHRRRIYAKLSSNMHAFRTEDSEQLVRTGLDDLGVSIHGLSEQSCRAYRPRCQFAEVIEKVKALVATRRRLASRTPAIHLNLIATHHNEHELGALPAFAATLGVGYWIQKTSLNLRMLPFDRRMNRRDVSEEVLQEERLALIEEWLPRDDAQVQDYYKYVRLHEGRFPPREEKWFRCTSPWNQMFVCWDGDVNLCCGSFEKRHSVGNVAEQPLHEIWNNALYHAARRAARGRPFATDPPVLCRECPGALL